jgi:hypothetical protein
MPRRKSWVRSIAHRNKEKGPEVAAPIDAQAEYEEARKLADDVDDEHNQMLDRYFRVRTVQPGERIEGGEALTKPVFKDFQDLVRRREAAHDRLRTALERLWGINEQRMNWEHPGPVIEK